VTLFKRVTVYDVRSGCIEEMKHTSDRGIFFILILQYALLILGTGESCQGSNQQSWSARPRVSDGARTLVGRGHIAYQRSNQKPYIEDEQTTQWPKEIVQKDKQRSTKHT
jgi:hypothetical protein